MATRATQSAKTKQVHSKSERLEAHISIEQKELFQGVADIQGRS